MSSKSLIPATSRSLVPTVPRKFMPVVQSVQMEAVCSALRLNAANQLTEIASDDVTHQAILHEAMIKAAPLADGNLGRIRDAYARVAERLIDGMAGS
jgi:hypothetical protein